jgi:hypothetical protein
MFPTFFPDDEIDRTACLILAIFCFASVGERALFVCLGCGDGLRLRDKAS